MGQKLYVQKENGAIVVKNSRKAWGVDTPSYCYDVWMPLIGLRPISVWGLLWRLARDGETSGIGLKRLAAKARMGEKAFADDVKLLHELKWLIFSPATQDAYTGEWSAPSFEILDPPSSISPELVEKYAPPSGYEPLTKWLVESEKSSARVASNNARGVASNEATPAPDDETPASNEATPAPDDESILVPSVVPSVGPVIEPATSSPARHPNGGDGVEEIRPEIYGFYEENFGALTPYLAQKLVDAVQDFSLAWVKRALEIAVENGKRNWRYADAILQRWKADGYDGDKYGKGGADIPKPDDNYTPAPESDNWKIRKLLQMKFASDEDVAARLAEMGLNSNASPHEVETILKSYVRD
jgi:DnaD/phage-associated family protein